MGDGWTRTHFSRHFSLHHSPSARFSLAYSESSTPFTRCTRRCQILKEQQSVTRLASLSVPVNSRFGKLGGHCDSSLLPRARQPDGPSAVVRSCRKRVRPYGSQLSARLQIHALMPISPAQIHQDRQQLGSQSLLKDYQHSKAGLVALAKHVYRAAVSLFGAPPTADEIEDALATTLFRDGIFASIIKAKPHIPTVLHQGYAESMARLLLFEEWTDIQR